MKKNLFFFLLIILFFVHTSHAANLTAEVDHTEIHQGETIHFMVSLDDTTDQTPNFSVLNQDFDIILTLKNQSLQVINQQSKALTQWSLELLPKKIGKIMIPAIQLGKQQTKPIELNVLKQAKQSNLPIFMTTEISPKNEIHLNEQIDYSVKIFYALSMQNAMMSDPQAQNAEVIKLNNDKNYVTQISKQPYQVFEQHFAIFPKQTGTLTIRAPVLSGFTKTAHNLIPVDLTGALQTISVLPAVQRFTAKNFEIQEEWQSDLSQVKVGDPIIRIITFNATGALAEQIPSIPWQKNNVYKIYPQKPILKTFDQNSEIKSQRLEKITYIFNQTGTIELPEISIQWFNPHTKKMEIASLPKKSIHVQGVVQTTVAAPAIQNTIATKPKIYQTIIFWQTISISLLILCLALFFILWRRKKTSNHNDGLPPLYLGK